MRWSMLASLLMWSGLAGTACSGRASYTLYLEPVFAPNQEPDLDQVADWTLTLDFPPPDEDKPYTVSLNGSGYGKVKHLPVMPEGTTIKVEGRDSSNSPLFLGRSEPLDIEPRGDVTVKVLVAKVDDVFTMNSLGDEIWGGALAPDGLGSFYLFGGTAYPATDMADPVATVQMVSVAPPESDALAFTDIGSIEELSSGTLYRSLFTNATATLLTSGSHAQLGKILVVGGGHHFDTTLFNGYSDPDISYEAFYFDPLTWGIELVGTAASAQLALRRMGHASVELNSGHVVVMGGLPGAESDSVSARVELFDPSRATFTPAESDPGFAMLFGAAAAMGDKAVYCGGIDSGARTTWSSSDRCALVKSTGAVSTTNLPDELGGLLFPAMATMSSKKVLITGGLRDVTGTRDEFDDEAEATDQVWMWTEESGAGTWVKLESMHFARAYHRAVGLADGRVLVIGGASRMDGLRTGVVDALPCAEILDPDADANGVWQVVGDCDPDSGLGALPGKTVDPSVSGDPSYGVAFAGGLAQDSRDAVSYSALFVPAP